MKSMFLRCKSYCESELGDMRPNIPTKSTDILIRNIVDCAFKDSDLSKAHVLPFHLLF